MPVLLDGGEPPKDGDDVLGCEWSDLISTTSGELLGYDHNKGVKDTIDFYINFDYLSYLKNKIIKKLNIYLN
jgi:hypothetical protein